MDNNKTEYTKSFTDFLEIMWGENFLSPGGAEIIDYMLQGINLDNKKLLDIGCGLGGPALYMATKFNVHIIGLDIDAAIINEAQRRISKSHVLRGKIELVCTEANQPLPFADNSFDIIFGKESWLHIEHKANFFGEIFRILKPGGEIVNLDWMHGTAIYSNDMHRFMDVDGLSFHFVTPREYIDLLYASGFREISIADITAKSLAETKKDCDNLENAIADKIQLTFGEDYYSRSLESWELQTKLLTSGEMRTGIVRAHKLK